MLKQLFKEQLLKEILSKKGLGPDQRREIAMEAISKLLSYRSVGPAHAFITM
jgi:hypothetical protein